MTVAFYVAGAVAILATALAISGTNAVHALLYLIVSLLAIAVAFYTLGAPFIAALEVIIYAGAIMVLFVFVAMMLNLGPQSAEQERQWQRPEIMLGPAALSLVLLIELIYVATRASGTMSTAREVSPAQVGASLFGPYLLGVELASMLLLAGVLGASYLGRKSRMRGEEESE